MCAYQPYLNVQNREMTGVSDYVCTSTFCVRHSNSERDWTLLRRSIYASFRVCSCVYVNFSFMKHQQTVLSSRAKLLAFQTNCVQVLFVSGVPLFRIGLSFFTITFQLYNYLTVYCNTRIKTVKSIKTIKYQCQFELRQFFKFQSHSLTQTIFEMTRFKVSRGTYDPL